MLFSCYSFLKRKFCCKYFLKKFPVNFSLNATFSTYVSLKEFFSVNKFATNLPCQQQVFLKNFPSKSVLMPFFPQAISAVNLSFVSRDPNKESLRDGECVSPPASLGHLIVTSLIVILLGFPYRGRKVIFLFHHWVRIRQTRPGPVSSVPRNFIPGQDGTGFKSNTGIPGFFGTGLA